MRDLNMRLVQNNDKCVFEIRFSEQWTIRVHLTLTVWNTIVYQIFEVLKNSKHFIAQINSGF